MQLRWPNMEAESSWFTCLIFGLVTPWSTAGEAGLLLGLPGETVWGLATATADTERVVGTWAGLLTVWLLRGTETTAYWCAVRTVNDTFTIAPLSVNYKKGAVFSFYVQTCEMADTDTGILIWWGVWCTSVACWFPAEEARPDGVETIRTWGREPAARWLTILAACWDVTGCETDGLDWVLGKMVPSWGRDGGETRRTLGDKRAQVHDYQRANYKNRNIFYKYWATLTLDWIWLYQGGHSLSV